MSLTTRLLASAFEVLFSVGAGEAGDKESGLKSEGPMSQC